ncbi:energy-coupling factor transporter ATP-binding protein EcfA2 [Actinomadura coerulea]|uniref:Energy-coupling factor transporter ATP-binding protein EcfA2 n=1 Tax=Actinomadura coerulea TaxID=46159 RepID=A0A7X0FTR7_9ACTN|nr:NACHT domain-containing protein [Actinomadura coerulea]MBB6393538.1 energy-coupling factor transporter ATP-binding protein EcfA2 [Actinomadura coerulea]
MGALEIAAVRVVCSILPIAGKKVFTKKQQTALAAKTEDLNIGDGTNEFISQLSAPQLRRLKEFFESPQYTHLTLQAMTCAIGGYPEDWIANLRLQVRLTLKHQGLFAEADLLQAVDAVLDLMTTSIFTVHSAIPGGIESAYSAAIAAQVAAAAARNSELLTRIDRLDVHHAFANRLRALVKSTYAKIALPSVVAHSKSAPYSGLYVPPSLETEGEGKKTHSSIKLLIDECQRFVVVGDPGAGKSTLARKLAYDISSDRIESLKGLVPLVLIVREHTHSLRTDHRTLTHYLEASCRKPFNVDPPSDSIEYLLLNGQAVVIIDGLDELGEAQYRTAFSQLVNSFAHMYPLVRVIVTTRAIGYPEAPLDEDLFPVVGVKRFSREQIASYVNKWFHLDNSLTRQQQDELRDSFLDESSDVSELLQNPLMLSLLCALYSSERFIPLNKPEIYHKCAEVLFDTWDRSRGIEVSMRFGSQVRPAVQRLAWRLFTDPEGRQAMPRSEIRRFLVTAVLASRYEDEDEAYQAADEFLDFCAGRAWVLTDVGSNSLQPLYGFTHRTFLEFFAASQLVKQNPQPKAVWEKIRTHVNDGTWEIVSQLAIQILDRNYEGGADAILSMIVDEAKRSSSAATRAIYLSFAIRNLETVFPGANIIKRLAEESVLLASALPVSERRHLKIADIMRNDLPLQQFLELQSPDNRDRAVKAFVTSLQNAVFRPELESAALLWAKLRHWDTLEYRTSHLQDHLGAALVDIPLPERVAFWDRAINRPTEVEIAELGVHDLYYNTAIGRRTSGSSALRFINVLACEGPALSPSEDVKAGCIEALADLHPCLVSNFSALQRIKISKAAYWDIFLDLPLKWRKISSLDPPEVRSSILMLLVPFFELPDFRAKVESESLRWIANARWNEPQRTAAIQELNQLGLPDDAHSLLVRWIMGEQFRIDSPSSPQR